MRGPCSGCLLGSGWMFPGAQGGSVTPRLHPLVRGAERRTKLAAEDPEVDLHDIDEEIKKLSQTKAVLEKARFSGGWVCVCVGGGVPFCDVL